jgi:hypothetical protein
MDMLPEPEATEHDGNSAAGLTRTGRPRRRVAEASSIEVASDSSIATEHESTDGSEL